MDSKSILLEGFDRIPPLVEQAVKGLTAAELAARPYGAGNSIAWLAWHLTRVEDDHIADAAGSQQVWTSDGWEQKFALPLDPEDTGFGHDSEQVSSVTVERPELLTDYHDAVHQRTLEYLRSLADEDLDRVVDENWDPPVTLGVRLVSVTQDCLQHAGQAAYVRGLLPQL